MTRALRGLTLGGMAFLSEFGERRLSEAIEAVEARSRAELVVVVRPEVGDYRANDLLVGAGVALATQAFLLYSSWAFELYWFLIWPPLAAVAAIAVLRAAPGLRAMFVGEARKRSAAETAARACFQRKGIRHTRERTGVLVFVATFEGRVVVLADSGVSEAVPEREWRDAIAPVEAVLADEGDATLLAERLVALGEILERWCEARPDDIDELPNTIDAQVRS